jgi:hypothetical protein
MKTSKIRYFVFALIAAILVSFSALSLTGCPPDDPDDGDKPPAGISVPGNTLAEKLAWVLITDNVTNGETYVITVNADEAITPFELFCIGRSDITIILWGSGGERIISLSSNGNLFNVGVNVTLVLDKNITLEGISGNNTALVRVGYGGALEMREGAKITGNTSYNGGGVLVYSGRTFTMNGGVISGNTATNGGGGVYVFTDATFTMNGGVISGNTTTNNGGGVYVGDTFRIVNGTVYGSNESDTSLKNTVGSSGAALYIVGTTSSSGIAQRGTFSDTTWTSAGDLSATNDTIKVVNGELLK